MTLWELTSGMVVRTKEKENSIYTVLKDVQLSDYANITDCSVVNVLLQETGFLSLEDYNKDLTFKRYGDSVYDIIEVYAPKNVIALYQDIDETALKANWKCIWSREEAEKPVEMTVEEIEQILGVKSLKIVSKK